MALTFAVAGLGIIVISWLDYLIKIPKEKVPKRPVGHVILMVIGIFLAIFPIVQSSILGETNKLFLPTILGVISLLLAGLFFYLLTIAALPDGELSLAIGDSYISFDAVDDQGRPFHTDEWKGQRVLFKIFRGHW